MLHSKYSKEKANTGTNSSLLFNVKLKIEVYKVISYITGTVQAIGHFFRLRLQHPIMTENYLYYTSKAMMKHKFCSSSFLRIPYNILVFS